MSKTWEELAKDEIGTIYHDEVREGVRFIVMRGPGALCAYAGVPERHPLAGHNYDNLPVSCHGGLTFAGKGDELRPEGWYWYGWDYAHSEDYCFYYDSPLGHNLVFVKSTSKKWLVEDVVRDSWEALYDFRKLMGLTESVANKVQWGVV